MKILFISANPNKTERLRFDKEFEEIHGSISVSKARKKITLQYKTAIKAEDVKSYIKKEKPDIVHFSGHGNSKGEIVLEDEKKNPKPISPEKFAAMFKVIENHIKCVFLSCCYSAKAAKLIGRIVDCVIGINSDLEEESAVAFASAFYLALGENTNLQIAFDFAVNEYLRGGFCENKPELFIKSGINPSETYFIEEKGI